MLVRRVGFGIALLLAKPDRRLRRARNDPVVATLGGPFQTGPRTLGAIAWAAIANTAVWVAVVALARMIVRLAGHRR
jgi:hypothetical protein